MKKKSKESSGNDKNSPTPTSKRQTSRGSRDTQMSSRTKTPFPVKTPPPKTPSPVKTPLPKTPSSVKTPLPKETPSRVKTPLPKKSSPRRALRFHIEPSPSPRRSSRLQMTPSKTPEPRRTSPRVNSLPKAHFEVPVSGESPKIAKILALAEI